MTTKQRSGHSTGLNAATVERLIVGLVPTVGLVTDLPSDLENWPLLTRTPVEQHAHVASSVAGGSEVGAGLFFRVYECSQQRINRTYMKPLRGAGLRLVQR